MLETLLKAFVSLLDGFVSILGIGHAAEKYLSESSVVGESKMDADARRWRERLFNSWWTISFLISLFLGGVGYAIWKTWLER